MMSIGSNLRLEHLEEQPLRSKKPAANSGSAAKPPKFSQKILNKAVTTGMNNSLAMSSGADDSTSGGGSSGSENSTERSNEAGAIAGNPLTNPLLRSPAKKPKTN